MIAGTAGGRRLATPPGLGTRPVTDRIKESLFATLGPDRIEGAAVLDLYAGSGALAIEALSRGARRAVLVERDARAVAVIRHNLEAVGFAGRATVHRAEVAGYLRRSRPLVSPYRLVFCDPPYEVPDAEVTAVLEALAVGGWVGPGSVVVMRRRAGAAPELPPGWHFTRRRAFGDTLVLIATVG